MGQFKNFRVLFDQLRGTEQDRPGKPDLSRLGRLQIDDEIKRTFRFRNCEDEPYPRQQTFNLNVSDSAMLNSREHAPVTHLVANIEDDQKLVRVHVCAHRRSDLGDLAFLIGSNDHLDLHCLDDEQGIARADILAGPD